MVTGSEKDESRVEYANLKSKIMTYNDPKHNTPDWLRSFEGCEHYNDAEAITVLDGLDVLATILLGNASHKVSHIDNQLVVSLKEQEIIQKRAA